MRRIFHRGYDTRPASCRSNLAPRRGYARLACASRVVPRTSYVLIDRSSYPLQTSSSESPSISPHSCVYHGSSQSVRCVRRQRSEEERTGLEAEEHSARVLKAIRGDCDVLRCRVDVAEAAL